MLSSSNHHCISLCLWTERRTPQSDWLMLRGLWRKQALWLEPGCAGELPCLRLWPSFMQGHGGEQRKRNTGQVVLVELLSVPDLSLHMLALKLYFPGQSGAHTKTTWQCFRTLFSLSFAVVADYDVHSRLSPGLQLVCNQCPVLRCHSCCQSPDYSWVHQWFSFILGERNASFF